MVHGKRIYIPLGTLDVLETQLLYVPPRVRSEANVTVMSCNCLHFILVELAHMKATLIPTSKGAYHLSELMAGKKSLVVRRIPLLIRTIQLDHFFFQNGTPQ